MPEATQFGLTLGEKENTREYQTGPTNKEVSAELLVHLREPESVLGHDETYVLRLLRTVRTPKTDEEYA